jgi:muramoyltetrapeptide carboxypeptidase
MPTGRERPRSSSLALLGPPTIPDVLDDHIRPLGVPACSGAMSGRVDRQFTLPLGVQVELDAVAGTITMLGSAVL